MAKFIPTKSQQEEAAKVAKELNVDTLFITKDGAFFTQHNRALLNAGSVKDDVAELKFVATEDTAGESAELKAANKVLTAVTKTLDAKKAALAKVAESLKAKPEDEKLKASEIKLAEAVETAQADYDEAAAEVEKLTEAE